MTAPTTTRSAFPPPVDDLMPRAIELTKTLNGELPSQNRLKTHLKIGADKAREIRTRLTALADRDQYVTDLHTPMVARGSLADRPPLHLLPDLPADPEIPAPDVEDQAVTLDVGAADEATEVAPARHPVTWPVLILCLPAFVAIWAGWVEMGRLTGFGKVTLLPGILDTFQLDTAITLPIGVETYAAYALWVWLSGRVTGDARAFAKWSAIASLALGGLGQITYHLMNAWHWTSAPWPITALVACIPVAVLGMGAALAHLMHNHQK